VHIEGERARGREGDDKGSGKWRLCSKVGCVGEAGSVTHTKNACKMLRRTVILSEGNRRTICTGFALGESEATGMHPCAGLRKSTAAMFCSVVSGAGSFWNID
jgi:hypothetical protein